MTGEIVVEHRGAIQLIRLNRPDKKNAINRAMYAAMTQALASGEEDAAVRVHVLFGGPGAFSAGNDLADFVSAATVGALGAEVLDFLRALVRTEKPVISGVDGIAIGIGTTLHLHCDLTFATPRSEFRTPFVELGLVPEAGSSLLAPALMGRQQAFALLCLGEALSAGEARAAGLVYQVVGEDKLEQTALDAAARLAKMPPEALRIARNLVRGDRQDLLERIDEEAEHFRVRLRSAEAQAAFMAFMQRKKAG